MHFGITRNMQTLTKQERADKVDAAAAAAAQAIKWRRLTTLLALVCRRNYIWTAAASRTDDCQAWSNEREDHLEAFMLRLRNSSFCSSRRRLTTLSVTATNTSILIKYNMQEKRKRLLQWMCVPMKTKRKLYTKWCAAKTNLTTTASNNTWPNAVHTVMHHCSYLSVNGALQTVSDDDDDGV